MKLKQPRNSRVNVKTTHYDREFKQTVVLFAESTSNREAEKKYGISESNVRRWRKLKDEIFNAPPRKNRNKRRYVMKKSKIGHHGFTFDRILGKISDRGGLGT